MLRRLTSPFVTASTMSRAWEDFFKVPEATAMRAMRQAREHPQKMWYRAGTWVAPLSVAPWALGGLTNVEPWSTPTQRLGRYYIQTAGLEILKPSTIANGSLTGDRVLPFFLDDEQGFDLNTLHDWWEAEQLVAQDAAVLPTVEPAPWVPHD